MAKFNQKCKNSGLLFYPRFQILIWYMFRLFSKFSYVLMAAHCGRLDQWKSTDWKRRPNNPKNKEADYIEFEYTFLFLLICTQFNQLQIWKHMFDRLLVWWWLWNWNSVSKGKKIWVDPCFPMFIECSATFLILFGPPTLTSCSFAATLATQMHNISSESRQNFWKVEYPVKSEAHF